MPPPLDRDRLRLDCLEVARSIAWRRGLVNDAVASSFADVLVEEAVFQSAACSEADTGY